MSNRYIAIGDIHGCNKELKNLLGEFAKRGLTENGNTFIFLGDYVDRGPDTQGVVDTLLDFQTQENCVFLMGNHEDMFLNYLDGQYQSGYMLCGGNDTLKSYGMMGYARRAMLPPKHRAFFERLYKKYETDGLFFCHAGIMPGVDLNEQEPHDLMWVRNTFLYSTKDHGKLIVHGHSVESTVDVTVLPNRINLDTGCVFDGHMSAAVFENDKLAEIIQVRSDFDWDFHMATGLANGGMGGSGE